VTASPAGLQVNVGDQITTTLADPPGGLPHPLGARVEVPVTRAIVCAYQLGTLADGVWTVVLDGTKTRIKKKIKKEKKNW